MLTALLFLLSAGAIYVACEFFVNGVEWSGRQLKLGATATGTVLAAFGTALPESAVTFFAVVLGRTPEQKDLGVGAALGGPLVLATIAYAIVGVALWMNRCKLQRADPGFGSSMLAWRGISRRSWRSLWSSAGWAWSPLPSSPGWACCFSPPMRCMCGAS